MFVRPSVYRVQVQSFKSTNNHIESRNPSITMISFLSAKLRLSFLYTILTTILSSPSSLSFVLALSGPSFPKSATDNQAVLERRPFLHLVAMTAMTAMTTTTTTVTLLTQTSLSVVSAAEGEKIEEDDPFAQMDSIISNQISNSSVGSGTVGKNSSGGVDPKSSRSENEDMEQRVLVEKSGQSDMEEELKTARKRRQVDPRTHG
jgi:hypothetical protein